MITKARTGPTIDGQDAMQARPGMRARTGAGVAMAATLLALIGGCSGTDAGQAGETRTTPSALISTGPTPTPTHPPVSYDALVVALPVEIGALEIRRCLELVAGTPEADQLIADLTAEGVPAEEAVLPDCDGDAAEVVRSASVVGSVTLDPALWPLEGGNYVSIDVREYADETAAASDTDQMIAGMADQVGPFDTPATATDENGSQTFGQRGTGTVAAEDVLGWHVTTAVTEFELSDVDGAAASPAISGCFIVMERGALVVLIHAAGDVPGTAGTRMTALRDGLLERAGAA